MPAHVLTEIEAVLAAAGEPLHYGESARRVLARGAWTTTGRDPAGIVNAYLSQHIGEQGSTARFERIGRGLVGLRAWTALGPNGMASAQRPTPAPREPDPADAPPPPESTTDDGDATLSFSDAAERVLDRSAGQKPMHYREITRQVLDLGLVHTRSRTPAVTLYAQIRAETERATKRGETPRFVKVGPGLFVLARWKRHGLAYEIDQHNAAVRRQLHDRLLDMPPAAFEALIGQLLIKLGFDDVAVTDLTGDGGIDVRGTLVVGDVIRTRMAVQVKRWRQNVQAPIVQQVRGSLGAHEQGLIITTSGFSAGAREEARRANAVPVALMDGEQLVALLVQHDLGVRRNPQHLLELGEADEDAE